LPNGKAVKTLIGIFTAVWILILLGTILIFKVIIPLSVFNSFFLNSILKAVFAVILVVVWLVLFAELRNFMIRSELAAVAKQKTG
jgi:glycerol-3-phosphate acyltransferase PlsY